jgi:RNA polymerase sigma-70 factor, ECF subfamily
VSGDLSDAELLRRHVDGDPEAFGEIARRHRDRLWAVALRTLGDPEEAADALQDALVSAFRAAGSFRGDSAVTTWLHRVVVNACLDRARRQAARPVVPLPEEDGARTPRARDSISSHETQLDVSRALAGLPFEQRAVLVLVDMQGYSVDETAQMLDIAPGTVKSRCARGRAKLAPLLDHLRPGYRGNPQRPGNVQIPEVGPDTTRRR